MFYIHESKHGHTVRGARSCKGMTPIRPSRPVYGYDLRCDCGWRRNGQAQEHKPEAESRAREHLREHKERDD